MKRAYRAALVGGFLLPLALALAAPPAAAEANPQVEAELTRLIAGYAASGQEDMDKLNADQQKQLAACAADVLGELPADDMAVLTGSQDLEEVMDTLGERFESRAGDAEAERLMGCFDAAFEQIQAAGTTDSGTTETAPSSDTATSGTETAPAVGIDAEFAAALEKLLRESDPPAEAAVLEMITCMTSTLGAVMTEAEKRAAIDTSFSEEVGQQMQSAHPAEFDAFMACGEAVDAKYPS